MFLFFSVSLFSFALLHKSINLSNERRICLVFLSRAKKQTKTLIFVLPPVSAMSNSADESHYCFALPHLPFSSKNLKRGSEFTDRAKPICYSKTQLPEEHLHEVQSICHAYAFCQRQNCLNFVPEHAVMCPQAENAYNVCMYEWAEKGLGSSAENDFLDRGRQFISKPRNTASQCKD